MTFIPHTDAYSVLKEGSLVMLRSDFDTPLGLYTRGHVFMVDYINEEEGIIEVHSGDHHVEIPLNFWWSPMNKIVIVDLKDAKG